MGALGVAGVGYNAMKQHKNSKDEVSVQRQDYDPSQRAKCYQHQQDHSNDQGYAHHGKLLISVDAFVNHRSGASDLISPTLPYRKPTHAGGGSTETQLV